MLSARSCIPCHSEPSRVKNLPFFFCLLLLFCSSCTAPSTPPDTLSIPIPERWSQDLNAQASNWLAAQLRVYEMPSQAKVHDTTMEVDETNGTVKAKSFKLPGGKTYKFIIEFQYLTSGNAIAFAYAEVEKAIGDGNAETVSFTSSDIRYEVDKQAPNISASISQGILPDLDPDNDGWSSYKELKDKVGPTDKTSIPQSPILKISPIQQGSDLIITLEGEDNAHVEEMKLNDPICGVTKISEATGTSNGKVTQKIVYRLDLLSVSSQLKSRDIYGTISDGVTSIQGQNKAVALEAINSTQSHPSFAFSDPELGTELEGMAILKGVACARYGVENISLKYNEDALIGYKKEETKNVLLRETEVTFRQVNTEVLPDGLVNLEVEVMDEEDYTGVGGGQYKVTNSSPIKIESPKGRKWVFGNEPISFNVVNQPKTTLVLATVSLEKSDEDINEDLLMVPLSPVSTNSNSATYTLDVTHAEEGGVVKILVSASQSDGSTPPTRTIKFKVRNKPKIKTYKAGELWKGWEGGKISYEVENVEKSTIAIEGQAKPSVNCVADSVNGIMSCKGELSITSQPNQTYLLKASRNSTAKEICEGQCNADQSITPEVTTLDPDMPRYGVNNAFDAARPNTNQFRLPVNNKEYHVKVVELDDGGNETDTVMMDADKVGGEIITLSKLEVRKDYRLKTEEASGTQILNTLEKTVTTGDNGLVLWLRFNEDPSNATPCEGGDAGETICDYSGNNNHGIPQGAPEWLEPPQSGILDGALKFDGVDDKIQIADSSSLNPVSVSVQAKFMILATNGGEQDIIDKRLDGYGFDLRVGGDIFPLSLVFTVKSDGAAEEGAVEVDGIYDNTIYSVTGIYDHQKKKTTLYNGDVVTSQPTPPGFLRTMPSVGSAIIGDRSFPNPIPHGFNGIIYEILVYERPLTEDESKADK